MDERTPVTLGFGFRCDRIAVFAFLGASLFNMVGCGGEPDADRAADRSETRGNDDAWKVVVDPAGEIVEFDPQARIYFTVPKSLSSEIVYPDCPSYFVAVGSNLVEREVREMRDVRSNARIGSVRNTKIYSGKKALSPDGRHFAAWTYGQNTIGVWDAIAETQIGQLAVEESDTPRLLMFAGNDRLIAAGAKDELLVWSIPGGTLERTIPLPKMLGDPVAGLSPGGKFLAVAVDEPAKHFVRVFALESGAIAGEIALVQLDRQKSCLSRAVAFAPDGTELAVLYDSFKTDARSRLQRLRRQIGGRTSIWKTV